MPTVGDVIDVVVGIGGGRVEEITPTGAGRRRIYRAKSHKTTDRCFSFPTDHQANVAVAAEDIGLIEQAAAEIGLVVKVRKRPSGRLWVFEVSVQDLFRNSHRNEFITKVLESRLKV